MMFQILPEGATATGAVAAKVKKTPVAKAVGEKKPKKPVSKALKAILEESEHEPSDGEGGSDEEEEEEEAEEEEEEKAGHESLDEDEAA